MVPQINSAKPNGPISNSLHNLSIVKRNLKTYLKIVIHFEDAKTPPQSLVSLASGYLTTSSLILGLKLHSVHFAVLLRLASSALENLSAKCTSCSFNSSTPKSMFEYTSPRKLGSVYSKINSGVLEAELVKFSPFSGELHL